MIGRSAVPKRSSPLSQNASYQPNSSREPTVGHDDHLSRPGSSSATSEFDEETSHAHRVVNVSREGSELALASERVRCVAGDARVADGSIGIGSAAPSAETSADGPRCTRSGQATAVATPEEPEIVLTAPLMATRARKMFVLGTSGPSASGLSALAKQPTKEIKALSHVSVYRAPR